MLHTFINGQGVPMVARLVKPGDSYGAAFGLSADYEMVEFYDQRYRHTMLGQFVTRYAVPTMLEHHGALCLDGGTPEWSITAENFESAMVGLGLRASATPEPRYDRGLNHDDLIDLALACIEIGQLVVVRLKSGQSVCGRVDDEGEYDDAITIARNHDAAGKRYSRTQIHASQIACITRIYGYGEDEAHVFNFDA
jgi:hypothetical protein